MDEPQRIGLTREANAYLDEMLESINTDTEGTAEKLIKFDLYRLAVAIGVKRGEKPTPLNDNADSSFRTSELDPDKALFIAVQTSNLNNYGESIYTAVERLAEQGIRQFYAAFRANMGTLPWNQILS